MIKLVARARAWACMLPLVAAVAAPVTPQFRGNPSHTAVLDEDLCAAWAAASGTLRPGGVTGYFITRTR